MPDWLIWVIVAGGLAAAETLSLDFVLRHVRRWGAAGAVAAALGAPAVLQVAVALVAAAAAAAARPSGRQAASA